MSASDETDHVVELTNDALSSVSGGKRRLADLNPASDHEFSLDCEEAASKPLFGNTKFDCTLSQRIPGTDTFSPVENLQLTQFD